MSCHVSHSIRSHTILDISFVGFVWLSSKKMILYLYLFTGAAFRTVSINAVIISFQCAVHIVDVIIAVTQER